MNVDNMKAVMRLLATTYPMQVCRSLTLSSEQTLWIRTLDGLQLLSYWGYRFQITSAADSSLGLVFSTQINLAPMNQGSLKFDRKDCFIYIFYQLEPAIMLAQLAKVVEYSKHKVVIEIGGRVAWFRPQNHLFPGGGTGWLV